MIEFQTENVEMPAIDIERVSKWLAEVASMHNCSIGDITYRFCSDDDILRYNVEFLGHDYYTDIITFDDRIGDVLNGDIVISLDTVASNASEYNVDYDSELLRVIVHGVLHLCGIDDKGPGEREIMEAEENKALEAYNHKG